MGEALFGHVFYFIIVSIMQEGLYYNRLLFFKYSQELVRIIHSSKKTNYLIYYLVGLFQYYSLLMIFLCQSTNSLQFYKALFIDLSNRSQNK